MEEGEDGEEEGEEEWGEGVKLHIRVKLGK